MLSTRKAITMANDSATAAPPFEDLLSGLENVVRKLEEEQLGLGEALKYYEQGIAFLKKCHESLSDAEQKIEVLAGVDAAGKAVTSSFTAVVVETLEEKQQGRSRKRSTLLE
jgi:exodeoxyribonuclease VII small subunit